MFNALNADTVLTYNQAFTPGGHVARAEHRVDGANRQDHRAVRLLIVRSNVRIVRIVHS